ncbi:TRAP transporter small permease subunit [Sulfobacillus acidophilus]|uniref:TRAP transporter small permease subunit n=1 Tax=Sulfobacillus acidophilus TaxID=53633 RepID=A0ABS3AYG2_9FIRM|nr:TRAP transporter small permease subunit [Sulfobacillus acidophilus]
MQVILRLFSLVDGVIYYIERKLVLLCVSFMTLLVFADVVQRMFSRQQGFFDRLIIYIFSVQNQGMKDFIIKIFSPWFLGIFSFLFIAFAAYGRLDRNKKLLMRSLLVALFVWGSCYSLIKGLLYTFPSGIPGAQKFALGFMMWAVFLGASIATRQRRHIILAALLKKVDKKMLPIYSLVGSFLTAVFCFYLAMLAKMQILFEYQDWQSAPGVGVFEALPVPLWIVTLALPISFCLIGIRFLANGINDFTFGVPEVDLVAADLAKEEIA